METTRIQAFCYMETKKNKIEEKVFSCPFSSFSAKCFLNERLKKMLILRGQLEAR
jgi:hypothetical protein